MVITVHTLLDHYEQGYTLHAWCPRCQCQRDVDLAKLIRNGKGEKTLPQVRIRHKCGATMEIQRTPGPRRGKLTAQVIPFVRPKR